VDLTLADTPGPCCLICEAVKLPDQPAKSATRVAHARSDVNLGIGPSGMRFKVRDEAHGAGHVLAAHDLLGSLRTGRLRQDQHLAVCSRQSVCAGVRLLLSRLSGVLSGSPPHVAQEQSESCGVYRKLRPGALKMRREVRSVAFGCVVRREPLPSCPAL